MQRIHWLRNNQLLHLCNEEVTLCRSFESKIFVGLDEKSGQTAYNRCMKGISKVNVMQQKSDHMIASWSMTYHNILLCVKCFVAFRSFWDLVSTFFHAATVYRLVDQLFYAVILTFALLSIFKHKHRIGVYCLYGAAMTDLLMQVSVLVVAHRAGRSIPYMYENFAGTLVIVSAWAVCTGLYYRKRWKALR